MDILFLTLISVKYEQNMFIYSSTIENITEVPTTAKYLIILSVH